MGLLNFPPSPAPGEVYTIGSNSWTWNGTAWLKTNTSAAVTFGTVTATTQISISTSTNSTSTTTGGLVVAGGIGIGGNQYIGGDLRVLSTTTSTSTDTGALTVAGGAGFGAGVFVAGRLTSESVQIAESVFDSTQTTTTSTGVVVIDEYSVDQYRGAKYLIQIDEGTGVGANFQLSEMLLLVNNNAQVYLTEYAYLKPSGALGVFGAQVGVDNVLRLQFSATTATNKVINVLRTAMIK